MQLPRTSATVLLLFLIQESSFFIHTLKMVTVIEALMLVSYGYGNFLNVVKRSWSC